MKFLPRLTNSWAVWIIAVGFTIVTWLVVLTAKVPNPRPPSKAAPQSAASSAPAPASGTEPNVTYVRTDFDKSVKPDAPAP